MLLVGKIIILKFVDNIPKLSSVDIIIPDKKPLFFENT